MKDFWVIEKKGGYIYSLFICKLSRFLLVTDKTKQVRWEYVSFSLSCIILQTKLPNKSAHRYLHKIGLKFEFLA